MDNFKNIVITIVNRSNDSERKSLINLKETDEIKSGEFEATD